MTYRTRYIWYNRGTKLYPPCTCWRKYKLIATCCLSGYKMQIARLWIAQQLHRLARWLEQLGTEPVCNQPHEWAPVDVLPVIKCKPGGAIPGVQFDAKGRLTVYRYGFGLGGQERGE